MNSLLFIGAFMGACMTAHAPSRGWWQMVVPSGFVGQNVEANVVGHLPVHVWRAPQQGVKMFIDKRGLRRETFVFTVEDADMLEARFDDNLRSMAYDVEVMTQNGARVPVLERARVKSDTLRVQWSLHDVRSVEITLHTYGRTPHIADFRVAKTEQHASPFLDDGKLYVYVTSPRTVRLCPATVPNEVDDALLADAIVQPTTAN